MLILVILRNVRRLSALVLVTFRGFGTVFVLILITLRRLKRAFVLVLVTLLAFGSVPELSGERYTPKRPRAGILAMFSSTDL